MNKVEFERVTPESVGIPSLAIEGLLDDFESGFTEPHGLMIMRHGKVCAEGYWAPYAKGLRHGLQSHTKTYTATAVGIAYTEGLLKLDDKVIDYFKEFLPENPSENLKKLTIHDVLCMGCGMDEQPLISETWIRDFFAEPVVHEPGTVFMYNNIGSTILGAIVKKVTGVGVNEYLKPRLFDKLGINSDNLRWIYIVDGHESGAGGLYTTVEDNLRLMKMYADGGVFNGERILAEDYVKRATTKQNDQNTACTPGALSPDATDNFVGYGYQIWMCRPKDSYRADGAMGQFTIVLPEKDMIVSITETATNPKSVQGTLDAVWKMINQIPEDETLPQDETASAKLAGRLSRLSLPSPLCNPKSSVIPKINGKKYEVKEGTFNFTNDISFILSGLKAENVSEFSFEFESDKCILSYKQNGKDAKLEVGLDGLRRLNYVDLEDIPISMLLASGAFINENTFELTLRWVETCFENKRYFTFKGDTVEIKAKDNFNFIPLSDVPIIAKAI